MTKQTINLGTAPNGAGGDTQRSAWIKAAGNFDELYQADANLQSSKAAAGINADIQALTGLVTPVTLAQGGTGAKSAVEARSTLGLGAAATRSVGAAAGNLMEVGAFGLGAVQLPQAATVNTYVGGFSQLVPATQYVAATGISYGSLLTVPYSQGETRGCQLFFGQAPESRLVFRSGLYASAPCRRRHSQGDLTMTRAAINLNGPTGEVIDVTSLGRNTITSYKSSPGEYRVQGTLGMVPPPEGWGYVINSVDAGVHIDVRHDALALAVSVSRDGVPTDLQHSLTLHVAVEPLSLEPMAEPRPDPQAAAQREIALRRAQADQAIAPLQDAVDLDEASDLEQQHLRAWKRYRVALNRLPDQDGFPDNLQWPAAPQ